MNVLAVAALAAVAACGPGSDGLPPTGGDGGRDTRIPDGGPRPDSAAPHTLVSIAVTAVGVPAGTDPTNPILELDLNTGASQTFQALGHYQDGADGDLSTQVTWSSDTLGTFTGASLDIPGLATSGATVTKIEAALNGVKGYAQLTVVAYRKSGAKTDFFFILPYLDPNGNQQKPLDFKTDVRSLDVFFAMDTTGSMAEEITNLQSTVSSTIVPQIQAQIPDTQFGVGAFEDFPDSPSFTYGAAHGSDCGAGGIAAPDQPFSLFQAVTADLALVQTGLTHLTNGPGKPIGCGMDLPESMIEALYQVATGDGLTGPALASVPANHTGVGGVAYRAGSMPVVIPITDSMSHAPGEGTICGASGDSVNYTGAVGAVAHGRLPTKDKLNAICAKVVGVASIDSRFPDCSGLADEEDFARATGARVKPSVWDVGGRPAGCAAGLCCTDFGGAGRAPDADGTCPLVFKVNGDGSGLGTSIVAGLKALTRYATFDVGTQTQGDAAGTAGEPLPPGATTADFLKLVQPISFVKPAQPTDLPDPTFDGAGFHTVTPGTIVTFQIYAFNDLVDATDQAQIFRAVIKVTAGGCTDLDQREVFILVPPKPIILG
ncbi:MAG TPA: hypothetical protein VGQ83_11190 [Polyangia bacterium]